MSENDRRKFLQFAGVGAFAGAMSASIDRALAIPASRRTGTIEDIEHIVILTQENRSFDQYFGTLRGVRGFDDPRAVTLANGRSVWHQPKGNDYVLPFRPDPDFGSKFLQDVDHGWTGGHAAWNNGSYDQWIVAKGEGAMTYYKRKDIPYHFALADAFTVCDAYFCSAMAPTDPNRYHMWTGWVGNDGKGGGPVITNAEAGYDWSTFPEKLQAAGISWKVYQDAGVGLTAEGYWGWTEDPYIGNYGDNSLLYFHQYQTAPVTSPLAQRARTGTSVMAGGTLFDVFRSDIARGQLPKVSYIAAPEAYSEHPNWIPNYGAWYISQILDALTANPEVWSKTVLFINYDEAGGFFDHVVPPTPPMNRDQGLSTVSTVNEIFPGDTDHAAGPYGLGTRVPMIVVSPWSKGGWVNSEVFDHTSLIRFIEKRFHRTHPALHEPNITPWRRAVAGDLTSVFDFSAPDAALPKLPSTASFAPPDHDRHADYVVTVPAHQSMPRQERGLRYARPLPYRFDVNAKLAIGGGSVGIDFSNTGDAAAVFQVRAAGGVFAPRSYTVGAHVTATDSWLLQALSSYDLSVHGPNGFFRHFKGGLQAGSADLAIDTKIDYQRNGLGLAIVNRGKTLLVVSLQDGYTGRVTTQSLKPGQQWAPFWDAAALSGWYDVAVTVKDRAEFLYQFAGHIETGRISISDPAIGGL